MSKISIKEDFVCSRDFTKSQMQQIADALQICCEPDDKCHKVFFAPNPPLDVRLPWQETDETKRPIGKVKYYTDGQWI